MSAYARLAVPAAVVSSALGGMALGATRFVVGVTDAVTLGGWRYGVGFVCLMPITLALRGRWPRRRDWPGVALLGLLFNITVKPVSASILAAVIVGEPIGLKLALGIAGFRVADAAPRSRRRSGAKKEQGQSPARIS